MHTVDSPHPELRPTPGRLQPPVQTARQQPDRVHRDDRHVPRLARFPAAAALFLVASLGIALVAGAAAAINCLVERTVDA
jgi:hypothetical protein